MQVHPVVEIAEKYGLVNMDTISRQISFMQPREVSDLYDSLTYALKATRNIASELPPSSFNFFVSSAMRGDRFCMHSECRLKKLPLIERYATLYGDRLFLPIRMSSDGKTKRRLSVETLLLTVASVRPLVDESLVVPIATGFCVCRNCRPLVEAEVKSLEGIGSHIAKRNAELFKCFYFWNGKIRRHCFVIEGPSEFVENGSASQTLKELPEWFEGPPRQMRELSQREMAQSGFVADIFNASAFDIYTQASLAEDNGCSYLSDSEAEAAFFDDPDSDLGGALSKSQFAEALMHEVPMFKELSANSILTLRREYPDAFKAYRSALMSAVAERSALMDGGELRAKEFYRDVIEPRVDELSSLSASSKLTALKTFGVSVALPTISLVFGLMDHSLPPAVIEAAKILGAAGIGKAVTDPIVDSLKRNSTVESNPYFFLLKMDKRWKAERETCG